MRRKGEVLTGLFLVLFLWFSACAGEESNLPGHGEDRGETVIYRDTWGVPHIYASSAEAGAYAMGWAQAEDRPEELLKNFLRGMGELASVEGQSAFQSDLIARLWDNYGVVQDYAGSLDDRTRQLTQSFVRGVNDYYAQHPEDVPSWWGERTVNEFMVHAFGRLFLYSWSIDDGFADLRRGGVSPNFGRQERASNQWAVAPSRSASGAPILLIDPHLSWWGASRFWEFRIHAGDLVGSGFTLPGFPAIGLGHTEHLAWAMTTGGPDTADVYEIELKRDDPRFYSYDNQWRQLTSREISIDVQGGGRQEMTIYYSHHGPVVAREGNKAYAMRMAYANQVQALDVWMAIMFAEDYSGAVEGMELLQLFPQNVMLADTSGNIYYQRTGRVPKRPEGYDFSRPVDGSTRDTEWDGFHPASDLVQILNPPQGYMQNCNIPPDAMMVDSPLQPEKYREYIYADRGHGPSPGEWTNQRGARAVQLLSADESVTVEEAIAYALDVTPYGSERWIELLARADRTLGESLAREYPGYADGIEDLLGWDRQLTASSTAALKYFYWRDEIAGSAAASPLRGIQERVDNFLSALDPAAEFSDIGGQEEEALARAFGRAMERLEKETGNRDASYGDVFRVGRAEESWPVGGGGAHGTSTLRNIGFGSPRESHQRWGNRGQTATQVVVLSNPVESFSLTPIGQSDRPESPHFDDQAEKLFSPRQMKPTWWRPEDLKDHIESREALTLAP